MNANERPGVRLNPPNLGEHSHEILLELGDNVAHNPGIAGGTL